VTHGCAAAAAPTMRASKIGGFPFVNQSARCPREPPFNLSSPRSQSLQHTRGWPGGLYLYTYRYLNRSFWSHEYQGQGLRAERNCFLIPSRIQNEVATVPPITITWL
jgi:hypothetical protein